MIRTYTLQLDEKFWLDVNYRFEPGEPEIHTYSNGDPGHPGSAPTIEVVQILALCKDVNKGTFHTVDIQPYLELADSDLDLWTLEDKILKENHEE